MEEKVIMCQNMKPCDEEGVWLAELKADWALDKAATMLRVRDFLGPTIEKYDNDALDEICGRALNIGIERRWDAAFALMPTDEGVTDADLAQAIQDYEDERAHGVQDLRR